MSPMKQVSPAVLAAMTASIILPDGSPVKRPKKRKPRDLEARAAKRRQKASRKRNR